MTAIAVLIITCPCALALAIPAVQVVASGALFRAGVILNAGDAIERLGEADTVVFDKTGTLTLPEPRVVNAAAIDAELLQMAARLALSSRHPLAVALAREGAQPIPYDGVTEEPGQGVRAMLGGVEARLGSAEFCGVAQRPRIAARRCRAPRISILSTAAARRPSRSARNCARMRSRWCRRLRQLRARSAYPVRRSRRGRAAGGRGARHRAMAGRIEAGGKDRAHRNAEGQGRRVLMVGDGLNDAPALAAAHVSLSPIAAADVTQAQADAVFLGERLAPVLDAIASRAARAR